MNLPYIRLTASEREEISRGLAHQENYHAIAARLDRRVSTISREIATNGGPRAYRAQSAETRSWSSSKHGRARKLATNLALQAFVYDHLRLRWSPDQLSR